jgi:hypothetical protein
MFDCSRQDIGYGFYSAVGMPGKPSEVIFGTVVTKIVEQEEWVEVGGITEPECPAQMHSRALYCRLGFDKPLDWSN